jgi:hypothetical protein
MATSGSKTVAVTSHDDLKFSWSLSSQSVANNTSTVSWKMQLISDSSGKISSTASKDWSVTVNGTKYSGTNSVGIGASTTKTLASGTTTISHSSDGTKTFSYSFSQEFAITFSGDSIGTKSGSGSGTLTTIPRKSTLSVGNGTLNTDQTLKVTRNSSSFTHTITAKCGSASKTICTKSTSTSITFKPPIEWASQNTTGTSVSVTYTITTYNGSTSLGSNTYTKTCSIPSSVKPTVSMTVSDSMGYASTYGGYIQGLSKIKVVLSASGSYSSTIKSYKTSANGSSYTSSSFTTGAVKTVGSNSISTTVTDSRGRTGTASKSVTVLDYSAPKISNMSIYRASNTSGTSDGNGAYLAVKFTSSFTSLSGKNTASYTLQYKKTTASSYTTKTLSSTEISAGLVTFAADTTSSYNVTLTLADKFKSVSSSGTGGSASKLFSIYKEGKGVAIGKSAEHPNLLDVAYKMAVKGIPTTLADEDYAEAISMPNASYLTGYDTSGIERPLIGYSKSNNITVGYGGWQAGTGRTHLYGNEIRFYVATATNYKPYYEKGDSVNIYWLGAGYCSSSSKNIYFSIPVSKPVIASPTVSITSTKGLCLRQNGSYTHGTAASSFVNPTSYEAILEGNGDYIRVTAIMSATTNATNNAAIAVQADFTINFT